MLIVIWGVVCLVLLIINWFKFFGCFILIKNLLIEVNVVEIIGVIRKIVFSSVLK